MEYERPNVLRGVHFGPGTSLGFDIPWWVNFLKSMHIGWIKIVDDAGSMMDFAAACRTAGIMPIIRLYRQFPYPGRLGDKDWAAVREYRRRNITRWFEIGNEPNLWNPEWHPDYRPAPWVEGEPAIWERPWFFETALPLMMDPWVDDAEAIVELGGYPAFPALAQCGFHAECGSIPFYRAMFNYLRDHHLERTRHIFENGGWLAVHDATLNHYYRDDQGQWHFEYPYDPICQAAHPGRTTMDDDNTLIGHEAPRDMIWNRWGLRLPIISTEGGIFLNVGTQWDHKYPPISSAEYHGESTLAMSNWLDDEYQKTHQWFFGMCPWLVGETVLGHQGAWDHEAWKKVDREEPVVRWLQSSPPRDLSLPAPDPEPPDPIPDPIPDPQPPAGGHPRPPGDNGIGIHAGLELTDESVAQDIVWMKAMRITWATVAYTNEDAMMRAARAFWAAGIMPICRWVGVITKTYDFARDARMLLAEGIPAYIQIFNEPSDPREWEEGTPADYIQKWASLWVQKAGEVVAAGGLPGLQCLHPEELQAVFNTLPWESPIWDDVWFCSHNYGLNHPPDWAEDYWCVLGFQFFEPMFTAHLGFVPPIICGEGGWLYKASDDDRYPIVDDDLHAEYHDAMYRWFLTGQLSDGSPLPDYLYAACPWILSGPSDEAWYGFTDRTQTIEAIMAIPEFVRGEPVIPEPPQPEPPIEVEYVGLSDEMKAMLSIEPAPDWARRDTGYWKVTRVEIQPEVDNFSAYAVLPPETLLATFTWAGGQQIAECKADPLAPEGAREWAASMPMFNTWGSYGVCVDAASEKLKGFGLYQEEAGVINHEKKGHHPTLVYFQLVQPNEQPEPPVEPPVGPPDELAYSLVARLSEAPYGFEDLREQVKAVPAVDMERVWQESLSAERIDEAGAPLFGNLRSIVLHHLGGTYYGWEGLVQNSIKKGNATVEYHFLIEASGNILFLVPVKYLTHHSGHRANKHGIAIAFEDEANEQQLEAGRFLVASLYEFMGQGWGEFRLLYLYPHSTLGYVDDEGNLWHTSCPGDVDSPILWSGDFPKLRAP